MSFWYDKKGKSYATKGNSSWVKAYAEHLVASLKDTYSSELKGHIAGTSGRHKAEDIIYDDTSSVKEVIKANAENVRAQLQSKVNRDEYELFMGDICSETAVLRDATERLENEKADKEELESKADKTELQALDEWILNETDRIWSDFNEKVDRNEYELFMGDICSETAVLRDATERLENEKADKEELESKADITQLQALDEWILNETDKIWYEVNIYKADKTTVAESTDTAYVFEFSKTDNKDVRLGEASSVSFTFGNGAYSEIYTSGLSFNSGATPTSIDYTDSGILNWIGTDCTVVDGLSIFQPSANTHYDIVFYFNGSQFIGLVNGFVPSVSR